MSLTLKFDSANFSPVAAPVATGIDSPKWSGTGRNQCGFFVSGVSCLWAGQMGGREACRCSTGLSTRLVPSTQLTVGDGSIDELEHLLMSELVILRDNQAVTTSTAIAEGVGNPHKSVIQLIRQNTSDLEEFGPLAFEMRVARNDGKGGQRAEVAILNEPQSTLLLTYMRNNDVVRQFKKALIRAFFEMRDQLNTPEQLDALPSPELTPAECQTIRELVKAKCDDTGKHYSEIYARIQNKFRVNSYKRLTRDRLSDAIIYITGIQNKPAALPDPYAETVTVNKHSLMALLQHAEFAHAKRGEAYQKLGELQEAVVGMWSHLHEMPHFIRALRHDSEKGEDQ